MLTETHMRRLLWRHCQLSLCTANLFFNRMLLFEHKVKGIYGQNVCSKLALIHIKCRQWNYCDTDSVMFV